jgi:hypothetical protein
MKVYKIAGISDIGQEKLDAEGWQTVDSQNLGDYELYLFKAHPMVAEIFSEFGIPEYQIGLQRSDTDFTDMSQQQGANPPDGDKLPIKDTMEWLKSTIEGWKGTYGGLLAMSHSDTKQRTYKAILKRLGIPYEMKDMPHPMSGETLSIIVI